MPFLPVAQVINAAAESTEKYLAFLTQSKTGRTTHEARGISRIQDSSTLLENVVWDIYRCTLPLHQTILSDSSATLIPDAVPGKEIEVRILNYDRRTGETILALRESVPSAKGKVVIDFRWLVRRCLDWFRDRGSSIPNITEIQSRPPKTIEFEVGSHLSEEQRSAIRTMLTNGLSYVWGPPGTGKTKWVLAKAARHCVDHGEKLLVLASTNLAVDNAVRAVLAEGILKEEVLRIGIPSPDFFRDYPECCEERAFQQQIREINSQIALYKEKKDRLLRTRELQEGIARRENELLNEKQRHDVSQTSIAKVEDELRGNRESLLKQEEAVKTYENELLPLQRGLDALAFPDLLASIKTLEEDQTRTISRISRLEKDLKNLRFWSTFRKRTLRVLIAEAGNHLRSIEATLESKRRERDQIAPDVNELKAKIVQLESLCSAGQRDITDLRNGIRVRENKEKTLLDEISRALDSIDHLEKEIKKDKEELAQMPEVFSTQEDRFLAEWEGKIKELETRLETFKQDLSRKSVLGMTLDGFIGLTGQMAIAINRVFIDEAPYAPLVKVLPLLSLHCPIVMLGDHLQLPPICECENDAVIRAYWAKPAIFLEDAFGLGDRWNNLDDLDEPQFQLIKKCILRKSYRFGKSLACLLDRYVYGNMGLEGLADHDTQIKPIDCQPECKEGQIAWQNNVEVDAILDCVEKWWPWAKEQPELPTIAVLTLYNNQAALIRKRLRARFRGTEILDHVEVWNTHKAQGREWDWVLFSVADTGRLPMNGPFLADGNNKRCRSREVLNTTISRAKRHLRVFLDLEYWKNRTPDSLLTELARVFGAVK
jgi:hypothetical protein